MHIIGGINPQILISDPIISQDSELATHQV